MSCCGGGYYDGYYGGNQFCCPPPQRVFGTAFAFVNQVGTVTTTATFPTFATLPTGLTVNLNAGQTYEINWSSIVGQSVVGSSVTPELIITGASALTIGGTNVGVGPGPIATGFGGVYTFVPPVTGVYTINLGISIPTPAGATPSATLTSGSISIYRAA